MENKLTYINISFENMVKYYKGCSRSFFWHYIIRKCLYSNFIGRLYRKLKISKDAFELAAFLGARNIIKIIDSDIYTIDYTESILKSFERFNTVYVTGWFFWPLLMEKYGKIFRKKYILKEKYYKDNKFYHKAMELRKGKTLIGIHVRRGDYKEWNNGKYYYNDEIYYKTILKMKQLIEEECIFIIFSNGMVEIGEKDGIYISKETWYIDQYIMSNCDYLIGPPSTFTRWASYMNEVKCYYIEDVNKEIKLNDFIIHKS